MSTFNLTISPVQIEYILKPGITITQAYEITNNSSETIYLNSEVLPFIPQGNNGSVVYKNISPNPEISFSLSNSNIQLNQGFIIPPKGKQQLVLKIKTSSALQLNDSYYTFFVYQQENTSSQFTQTTARMGSHILLSLSDKEELNPAGEITNFSIQPRIKDVLFNTLTFKGEIKNNSSHFFKSTGKIILSKNDQVLEELILQENNVLSNHYRQINCQNEAVCTLRAPFWPGKYTATLELDSTLNIPASSISFFIFPISPIILILSLVAISLLLRTLSKKLKKIFKKY